MTLILYCYLCSCVNEDQCSFDNQNTKVSICKVQEDPDNFLSDFVNIYAHLNQKTLGRKSLKQDVEMVLADAVIRYVCIFYYITTYKIVRTTNPIRYLWIVIRTDFSSKVLDIYGN